MAKASEIATFNLNIKEIPYPVYQRIQRLIEDRVMRNGDKPVKNDLYVELIERGLTSLKK